MKFAQLGCTYFDGGRNYRVDVSIRRQHFLFFERFLTPVFEIKIENKGENIENGTIECYIAEWDNPNTCSIIEEKYFMHFQTFRFNNFKKDNTLKYKPKVNPDFIKQNGKYIVRFIVRREVPYEKSKYDELKEQHGDAKITITEFDPPILAFKGNAKTWATVKLPPPPISGNAGSGETPKVRTIVGMVDELVKIFPDWKKPKVGVKQGIPIADYRWNRIVAVYPLTYLFGIVTLIIGIVALIVGIVTLIIRPEFKGFIDYIHTNITNISRF